MLYVVYHIIQQDRRGHQAHFERCSCSKQEYLAIFLGSCKVCVSKRTTVCSSSNRHSQAVLLFCMLVWPLFFLLAPQVICPCCSRHQHSRGRGKWPARRRPAPPPGSTQGDAECFPY